MFIYIFTILDSSGNLRDIWVRYVREYPVENNDWGDFQTHRRLLGLITIGKFDAQNDLNELCRIHESLKVKYTNTLFDSRCILFGSPSNGKCTPVQKQKTPPSPNLNANENGSLHSDAADEINSINSNSQSCAEPGAYAKATSSNENTQIKNESNETSNTLYNSFKTPANFKSSAIFYTENDACNDLESLITEFVNSIFWILESKRLERTKEKIEKVSLLLAPFEKKDFIGLNMDKNMRKRCVGRVTKHLADLTLQSGLVAESLALFQAAAETLRAISDSLWLGAANEGNFAYFSLAI